ncbi:MAG: hypothetical protein ACP5N1_07360 [Candidatus Woesearchaeota archaeon]
MADEKKTEISNKTIAILIVLALVISIIGTWAVLSGVAEKKQETVTGGGNVGIITLNILPPNTEETNNLDGKIVLEIE